MATWHRGRSRLFHFHALENNHTHPGHPDWPSCLHLGSNDGFVADTERVAYPDQDALLPDRRDIVGFLSASAVQVERQRPEQSF